MQHRPPACPDLVPGTYAARRQFGMLRISDADDCSIALESYDQKGEMQWRHELRARDLRSPR